METLAMAPLDGSSSLAEAPRPIESRWREPAVVQPVSRRAEVRGKFLFVGDEKLWVRGVTYGTFGEGVDGSGYPPRATVAADFAAMAEAGLNALRVYIPPPRWLLELAAAHGLRVMV